MEYDKKSENHGVQNMHLLLSVREKAYPELHVEDLKQILFKISPRHISQAKRRRIECNEP